MHVKLVLERRESAETLSSDMHDVIQNNHVFLPICDHLGHSKN